MKYIIYKQMCQTNVLWTFHIKEDIMKKLLIINRRGVWQVMNKIKDFFGRVKNEKDFRFDFIIGIWSLLIIIALIVAIIMASLMLLKKDNTDEGTEPIATPSVTLDPESDDEISATKAPSIFDDVEDDGGRFEEDIDDEFEFEDSDSSMMKATTTVNVRTSPETTASSLGKLNAGETVEKLEELNNGWVKVKFKGKEAYVKSEFLTPVESEYIGATYPPTQNNSSNNTTAAPRQTKKPVATAKPKATKKPKVTESPDEEDTDDTAQVTEAPVTEAPVVTQAPEPTLPPAEPTNVPAEPTVAPEEPVTTETPAA